MLQTIPKVIAFSCVLTLGCTSKIDSPPAYSLSTPAPVDWDMSPTDAVNIATRYATDNRIPLGEYGVPGISTEILRGERIWAVLYFGKSRIIGDHFMLLINDDTRAVEYVPGE